MRQLDYSSTKVILNGGEYTGFVNNMGAFNMYEYLRQLLFSYVDKTGVYKLDAINLNYHFESVNSIDFFNF